MVELTAVGPDDPDRQQTAAVLAAYFNFEHTRALRQLLSRRLAIAAIIGSLVEAVTPVVPGTGLLAVAIAFLAAATAAAVAEWRAENNLRQLIASRGVLTQETDASAK